MDYQCPQCHSYEVTVAKPKSIWVWLIPMTALDVAIVLAIFLKIFENPMAPILALIVVDGLFTLPLLRAFMARSQTQGRTVYRCTSCGHAWMELDDGPAPATPFTDGAADSGSAGAIYDFRMTVEDVFGIKGRGTVITGRIESGTVGKGAVVTLHGASGDIQTVVDGIEMFHKTLEQAGAGDNVGLLLRGIGKEHVQRGDILQG